MTQGSEPAWLSLPQVLARLQVDQGTCTPSMGGEHWLGELGGLAAQVGTGETPGALWSPTLTLGLEQAAGSGAGLGAELGDPSFQEGPGCPVARDARYDVHGEQTMHVPTSAAGTRRPPVLSDGDHSPPAQGRGCGTPLSSMYLAVQPAHAQLPTTARPGTARAPGQEALGVSHLGC